MSAQHQSQVPVGTIFEGKFRVTREIGRGGMAAVYEAVNVDIGKRVAVKVLSAELLTSHVVRERFLREARASAAVRSPYICDVYDSGTYEERPFLVMELLEGESLYDLLSRERQLSLADTLTIAAHAARGLAKAHEANIVHRDLKPENIFLTTGDDGKTVAKLLDFGLAKFYESTGGDAENVRLTREGALFGTPAYMSPEQAKGMGDVDHRADLWALGCLVYECLTGRTVWNVEQGVAMILAQIAGAPVPRPSRMRPDLPPAFDEWFAKALNRDPDKRFQTATEFADNLTKALHSEPVPSATGHELPPRTKDVDELIESLEFAPDVAAPVPLEVPGKGGARQREAERSKTLRAVGVLVVAASIVLGTYALWLYVLHPAQPGDEAAEQPEAVAFAELPPAEEELFAAHIHEAQEKLTAAKPAEAVSLFKRALEEGSGAPAARSLLSHAEIVIEEGEPDTAPCRLTGLGRPRPFELQGPASRPSLAIGLSGPVVAWADNHLDERKHQAFTVLLDKHLRRVSEPRAITPEATAVRQPQLVAAGDKLGVVYWESAGEETAVYTRLLDADGSIASPSRRISAIQRHAFHPSLARNPDGSFWAVWEKKTEGGVTDIVARHLDVELKPLAPAVRLTAFAPKGKMTAAARKPDVAAAHGHLHVVFSLHRTPIRYQAALLRIPLDDPGLKSGVAVGQQEDQERDRFLGSLQLLSGTDGKNDQGRIGCTEPGCLVVWDAEHAGAFAAFIGSANGEKLWHREFAPEGSRPALGIAKEGAVVGWFAESRFWLASISKHGVGKPSILTRVSGFQPFPSIVPGTDSAEWYISWRDFEAGDFEVFALRAACK